MFHNIRIQNEDGRVQYSVCLYYFSNCRTVLEHFKNLSRHKTQVVSIWNLKSGNLSAKPSLIEILKVLSIPSPDHNIVKHRLHVCIAVCYSIVGMNGEWRWRRWGIENGEIVFKLLCCMLSCLVIRDCPNITVRKSRLGKYWNIA